MLNAPIFFTLSICITWCTYVRENSAKINRNGYRFFCTDEIELCRYHYFRKVFIGVIIYFHLYILCSFESACNDLRILINCKFVDVTFIDKNILFQRPRANTSTRKLLVTLCKNNTIVYFWLAFETFYFHNSTFI